MNPSNLISVSAVVVGFGATIIVFRVNRELYLKHERNETIFWLPWADYLILSSVALAIFGTIMPLLTFPRAPRALTALGAASSVAALTLQAGYIPAILAHYRIEIGRSRVGKPTEKGEPLERLFVALASLVAAALFTLTLVLNICPT